MCVCVKKCSGECIGVEVCLQRFECVLQASNALGNLELKAPTVEVRILNLEV